jgi:hypothetical protein
LAWYGIDPVPILNYGGTVKAIGNQILSGLTCLAALLTPLSGISYVICRCPNGQVKPFCVGMAVNRSGGCCCGGACCCCCRPRGATCAGPGSRETCCGSHQAPSEEKSLPGGTGVAEAPCCMKTLVAAESPAVAPDKGHLGKGTRHAGDPVAAPAVACTPAGAPVFRTPRPADSPRPPADLVTLLRRLVI